MSCSQERFFWEIIIKEPTLLRLLQQNVMLLYFHAKFGTAISINWQCVKSRNFKKSQLKLHNLCHEQRTRKSLWNFRAKNFSAEHSYPKHLHSSLLWNKHTMLSILLNHEKETSFSANQALISFFLFLSKFPSAACCWLLSTNCYYTHVCTS